jgi:hypothetical protein
LSFELRRRCAWCVAIALFFTTAGPAAASPETLKRSMSNIIGGPMDVALSPISAANGVYTNLNEIDDSTGVKIAYTLPGFVWGLGLGIGAGAIRAFSGLLELIPGIVLLPFSTDLDAIFAPGEKGDALLDYDTPVLNVKWGIYYMNTPY